MIGFDEEKAELLGSHGRYEERVRRFQESGVRFPRTRHYFWWMTHNLFAHGMLAVFPCRPAFRFHDWTSVKLNAG